jgi:hypothetical protein
MTTPYAGAARELDARASPAREKRRGAFGGRGGGKLLLWLREGGRHEVMETWSRDGPRIVAFAGSPSVENSRDHVCTIRLYCERRCVAKNFASIESESRVRVCRTHGGHTSHDRWREGRRTRRRLRNASGFKEPDVLAPTGGHTSPAPHRIAYGHCTLISGAHWPAPPPVERARERLDYYNTVMSGPLARFVFHIHELKQNRLESCYDRITS